jgi:hypothetical protein
MMGAVNEENYAIIGLSDIGYLKKPMGCTVWVVYVFKSIGSARRIYVGSRDGAIGLQIKQVSPFQAVFFFIRRMGKFLLFNSVVHKT